ncbi:MAG: DUF5916 domain-containing protein [Spirosomataceae bacterium]
MKKRLLFFFILIPTFCISQDGKYNLHIKRTAEPILLDGELNEGIWQQADATAEPFFQKRPFDTSYADFQSKVMMTFDDKFLYIAAKINQPKSKYTTASLKRDFEGSTSDVFVVYLDTFKDRLNGFQFAVSPFNVQREGLISFGEQIDNTWDNKWYTEVQNYDDYWTVEIAIPFKTLRYKVSEGNNEWRINFGRNYIKHNEVSAWFPVPRNFRNSNLSYTGLLIWDDAPPRPGTNIALIPYISGGVSKDFPRNPENLAALVTNSDQTGGVGLDAKIAVTPSLNLDLTVNPDFSQVEVDQQQTNLSRFELFFPERRQFFIENSDLFGNFGFPNTRPFFSRRIGITRNPNTGAAAQVPILAGARLSGKLNDDWRIGVMNMQSRKVDFGNDKVLPATNYTVATLQRKVFKRSALGGIFVNKQNMTGRLSESQLSGMDKYNRVAGLEFNYYTPDNRFDMETYVHKSFSPDGKRDETSIAHYMGYHHPNIDLNLGVSRVGENFNAETGFVPRRGVISIFRPIKLTLNPKSERINKIINSYGLEVEGEDIFNLEGERLDTEQLFSLFVQTQDRSQFYIGYYMGYTNLFFPFDPTNASDNPNPDLYRNVLELPVGVYRYQAPFIGFETSNRYDLQGEFNIWNGEYFNGKGTGVESSLSYRLQPYGVFTVNASHTNLRLPEPYNSASYWLIGSRAELSFTRKLFFSTFFQYNTQTNNTNINSRLQWRFKPVSDLFIVYTDNYFAENITRYQIKSWTPKNRALIIKLTYWLNV